MLYSSELNPGVLEPQKSGSFQPGLSLKGTFSGLKIEQLTHYWIFTSLCDVLFSPPNSNAAHRLHL